MDVSNPVLLAEALDDLRNWPHSTAGLSMADEATLAYRSVSLELDQAHQEFRRARNVHKDAESGRTGYPTGRAWDEAMEAAGRLAELLRALGPPLRTVE